MKLEEINATTIDRKGQNTNRIVKVPDDCGTMKPRIQALSTKAYKNMVGVVMVNTPETNSGCSCAFSLIRCDKEILLIL